MEETQEILLGMIEDALGQLEAYPATGTTVQAPLPSLLQQCEDMLAATAQPEPVRTVHHLACTGGTVISKCLALMANVVLLSEIDPLSRLLERRERPAFVPTDLIHGLRHSLRGNDEEIMSEVFAAGTATLRDALSRRGQVLVLRDHPHSHFFLDGVDEARPTLREILAPDLEVLPLVTLRHPVDSFMSLRKNRWETHFSPSTLDEYARRSLRFLRRYADVPQVRYEEFTAAPEETLEHMCRLLRLDYSPGALDLLPAVRLSGDSGRSDNVVRPRPPRPIPEALAKDCAASAAYEELCALTGYDPARSA